MAQYQRFTKPILVVFYLVFALAVSLIQFQSAHAAGVVGDGTPASCTEAALQAAVTGGGLVTFNCGQSAAAPVTILLTQRLALPTGVVIDGGDKEAIVLNGGDPGTGARNGIGIFAVDAGVTAELRNIKLLAAGDSAILNHGALTLDAVEVQGARALQCAGIQSDGQLTVLGASIITTNAAETLGGGVCILGGAASLDGSDIRYNSAGQGGGLYVAASGAVDSVNSYFTGNSATEAGAGVYVSPAARLTMVANALVLNSAAPGSAGLGGGLYNGGDATLLGAVISQNEAHDGGGVYNAGTLTVLGSDIDHNVAATEGGFGGGFYNSSTVSYTTSSLVFNSAGSGGGFYSSGELAVVNSTVADNSATVGGNLVAGGAAAITYGTLTGNAPHALAVTGGAATVLGSIVDGCTADNGAISSQGHNFDLGDTCGFAQPGDRINIDPQLGPLQQVEGRHTWHRLPLAGSPAIGGGETTCPTTGDQDQHGVFRPAGLACAVGAVEMIPPMPVCGGEFLATADATISSSQPTENLGAAAVLALDNQGEQSHILLDFAIDPAMIPAGMVLSQATLHLAVNDLTWPANSDILAVSAVQEAWSENSVTWATQPAAQNYTSGGAQSAGLVQVDVTTLAMQWATGQLTETSLLLQPATLPTTGSFSSREGAKPPKLVIQCARLETSAPGDPVAQSAQQEQALVQLHSHSTISVTTIFENRALTFGEYAILGPTGVFTDALALWFLDEYQALLGTTDPWQLSRRAPDGEHVFFRQLHDGVPVYPAEIGVHLDGNTVTGIGGAYVPEITLAPAPALTAAQAEQIAVNAADPAATVLGATQLRYVNLGLFDGSPQPTHLAWQVHLPSAMLLVDANSGEVLFSTPTLRDEFELDLEDGKNVLWNELCDLGNNNNIDATFNADARNITGNTSGVWHFWVFNFGRDSYDDDGEQIEWNINVNFGGTPNAAYSSGCDIFLSSPGITAYDTVAHEFTHGVVHNEIGLPYRNLQGALDESLADTFAAFADGNWIQGDTYATPWRDLSNPPAFQDPDRWSSPLRQPPMGTPVLANDYNGVHVNSGITNKAAFLLTVGQNFNGHNVVGIGRFKAMKLYYNVLVARLTGNSDIFDMRNQMVAEAKSLRYRAPYFSAQEVCSVIEAFAAVELGPADRDCNGLEDAQQDDDGDGVPNSRNDPAGTPLDNCRTTPNPLQENNDGDAFGNVCDSDNDNDGVPDFEFGKPKDNCRWLYNPDQHDLNLNGKGDACDADMDGDGRPNNLDNCPSVANPGQENVDLDLFGDVCDADADNDLICNVGGPKSSGNGLVLGIGCSPGQGALIEDLVLKPADNCRVHANGNQADADKDGIGDVCDLCPAVSNGDNGDPDGDGRGNPCDNDDDNDGLDDFKPDGSPLDNCREVPNPDQFDGDKNGVGIACDLNEQAALNGLAERVLQLNFKENEVLRIPLGACPACGGGPLPNNLEAQLVFESPVNVAVQVVDSAGFVVAKGNGFNTQHTLSFSPPPRVNTRVGRTAAAMLAEGYAGYTLEVVPADTIDLEQEYVIDLAASTSIEPVGAAAGLYLPLVTR